MTQSNERRCVYCGSAEVLTTDHVVPISRWREVGVSRRVLDNSSNQVVGCRSCNEAKGALLPQEWFALHPEYKQRFIKKARYLSDTVKGLAGL